MNPDVNGMLSVYGFLSIVEKQMERTNERIAAGCKPETKAVEATKNLLLAVELQKLVDGRQGIMNFLDNCGSIVQLKSEKEANAFVPRTISPVEDIEWKPVNKDRVTAAAQGLHRRLHPGSEMDDDDILKSVTSWAFQVPPEPDVCVPPSQTRLSLIDNGPRKLFLALMERVEKESRRTFDQEKETDRQNEGGPFLMRTPFSSTQKGREAARRNAEARDEETTES